MSNRFRAAAPEAIANDWIELLYGAAGALVGARLLGLDDVARDAIQRLWSTWTFDSKLRACIWTQHVPTGRVGQSLGMAHGFAGNVFALLKAAPLQSKEHQTELMHRDHRDAPSHGSSRAEAPELAAGGRRQDAPSYECSGATARRESSARLPVRRRNASSTRS